MSNVEFDVDFQRVERNPALVNFMQRFGAAWLAEAQRLAQIRIESQTGDYNRNFRVELIGGSPPKLRVGNASKHAIYVEEDTVDHFVEPTPKGRSSFTNPNRPGALRWFDPPGGGAGAAVFSRGHKVSGTRGKHIVKDAVTAAGDNL